MYPLKTKTKYDPSNLASSWTTFTTVYLGNYVSGNFDEDVGSHCGVDIVPMIKNDDVFAVLDGTVTLSDFKSADGNVVVIRHENVPDPENLSKTTTLYSVYLHLDSRSVSLGEAVKEGQIIGKSGNTGNSTGEHLHFQIDRKDAPFHPYWPFTMGEANEAGLGFLEAVNRGLGIEKARKYTVNPLVYLDAVEALGESKEPPVVVPVEKPAEKPVVQASFSDVPTTHPHAEAIAFVKARGIASGEGGFFRPEAPVTRAELLKMAFIASGKTLSETKRPSFSDVPADSWYLPYVNTAVGLGAVSGYSDGSFRPNHSVTRAEALKIVLGILSVTPEWVGFKAYSDVDVSAWYAPHAAWAKAAGIFEGANFRPDAKATRAEIATLVFAAMTQ